MRDAPTIHTVSTSSSTCKVMIRQLIAEAERLARPSFLLSRARSPADIVGWWRGMKRPVEGRKDDTHRISIDCGRLPARSGPIEGEIGVYDVAPRWNWPVPIHVEHVRTGTFDRVADATPLSGREALSLPPLEALCLYGGPPVEEWLASAGLERTDYEAAAALDVAREYQAHFHDHCPLYSVSGEVAAVLGGWHLMWPDDDFYIPAEMRLVVWTLWEAEPWIEVFARGAALKVRVRSS